MRKGTLFSRLCGITNEGGSSIKAFRFLFILSVIIPSTFLPAAPASAQPPAAVPAGSSAALRLVGTVESREFSGAVLDDASGTQLFLRLHEQLPDGSRIVKVLDNSIMLKRSDGMLYELFVTQDVNAAVPANIPSVSRPAAREEEMQKTRAGRPRPQRNSRIGRIRKPDPGE